MKRKNAIWGGWGEGGPTQIVKGTKLSWSLLKVAGGGISKMLIKWRESCGGGLHISFQNGLPTFGGYGGERRRCWWEGGSSFSHPAQWDQWEEFWDFISWKWICVKRISLELQCSGATLSQRQKSRQLCFSIKLILSLIEEACGRLVAYTSLSYFFWAKAN